MFIFIVYFYRIIISILDAFHFDLSLSTAYDYFTEKKENLNETATAVNEDGVIKIEAINGDDKNHVNGDSMEIDENNEKTSKEIMSKTVKESLIRKKQLMNKSSATKIHLIITKTIIPLLFKCIAKKSKADEEHKINKKSNYEDEYILRVPLALAILKLLNNLPVRSLETHLPGLLLKVCEMLKSRALSVRQTTRECLIKMINTLDKRYYHYIFKELSNSLTRGYQVRFIFK